MESDLVSPAGRGGIRRNPGLSGLPAEGENKEESWVIWASRGVNNKEESWVIWASRGLGVGPGPTPSGSKVAKSDKSGKT